MIDKKIPQYEFEYAIYQTLAFGDELKIAQELSVSPGIVSQYFNPNDERESVLYKAVLTLAAMIKIDRERGCHALSIFTSFVESACPCSGTKLSIDIETVKGIKEDTDVQVAYIEKKPLYDQLLEVNEAIDQKLNQKKAIIEAISAETATP
jgi:hypothetical protein